MQGLKNQIIQLHDAINFSNRMFPLPRCKHKNALKDHGGYKLYPSCGCTYDKEINKFKKIKEESHK